MAETPQPALKKRDQWSGRSAFVLAAIGSAVGLGNLWGFPYKLYAGGGGAFLIPYFIAILVLGLPLLIGEFSLGHWAQQSPPRAFGRIARQYRFVGWWVVVLGFLIITYYCVVLSYCVLLLFDSLGALAGGVLPWAESAEVANDYFFKTIVSHGDGLALTGLQWPVVAGLAVSWALIYLCLFRGVGWVSKVVLLTVPLPWFMLLVLTVRGLTLEGAVAGLKFYLEPDWSKLAEAETWRLAFGQVFFTLSLGFGVMLSYASFLHRRSDLNNNALIVGLGDLATSFIAGLAVFSTLGAMAVATQQAVPEAVSSGFGLAFVAFPYALAELPAGQAAFSAIFFIALLTLGIDSAFSIVEAVLASVDDNTRWARKVILPVICIVGFLIGLLYCTTNGGLNWLGLMDTLVFGPVGILVAAAAEALVFGWAIKGGIARRLRDHANERSDWRLEAWWEWAVRIVAPLLLLMLFVWTVSDFIADLNWPVIIGMIVIAAIPVVLWLLTGRDRERATTPEPASDPGGGRMIVGVLVGVAVLAVAVGLVRLSLKPDTLALANADTLTGERVQETDAGGVVFNHPVLGELTLTPQQLEAPAAPAPEAEPDAEQAAEPPAAEEPPAPEPPTITLANGDTLTLNDYDQRDGTLAISHPVLGEMRLSADQATLPQPPAPASADAQLEISGYIMLAVALFVIFGGLAWCFWRAMVAAGGRDVEIQDEPSI